MIHGSYNFETTSLRGVMPKISDLNSSQGRWSRFKSYSQKFAIRVCQVDKLPAGQNSSNAFITTNRTY